jgi:cold shock CspA family protein
MKGLILHLYLKQEKGLIRGDDGAQVPFRKAGLADVEFRALSAGQKVSYQIQDGWLGKEAVEVRPVSTEKAPENV